MDDKKTLSIEGMNDMFDMMDEDKKVSYDKAYIEELYLRYMATGKVQEEHKTELNERLKHKRIILVAPGKSSVDEADRISAFKCDDVILVSVNYAYENITPDFIFLSNLRRFRELDVRQRNKCIVTSNIPADGVYYQTKYRDLLNSEESVADNAGLMAIKFLMQYDVEGIYLAGFDGYSHDVRDNYGSSDMAFITRNAVLDAMNIGMSKILREYSKNVRIEFITTPKFVVI